jgi:hypothetical protein|eukprot:COSAG01_NODE_8559_length_2742_cov_4.254257_2_plen_33_part_00
MLRSECCCITLQMVEEGLITEKEAKSMAKMKS